MNILRFFRRDQLHQDLEQEMKAHVDERVDELVRSGVALDEARRVAAREFGNRTGLQEEAREVWTIVWFDQLAQDIRYAIRALRRTPGFTIVVMLTLALGIGMNTAIFSVVNAVLLQPLPFKNPDDLAILWVDNKPEDIHEDVSSYPNFEDWRNENTVFDSIAAYSGAAVTLTGSGEPEQVRSIATTPGLFHTLGVEPAQGRAFLAEENQVGRDQVVVISDGLWKRKLGGVPNAVGQSLILNGKPYVIVGIMPKGFEYPERVDLWMPLAPTPAYESLMQSRGSYWLSVIGRLKSGVSVEVAQSEMSALAKRLEARYPNFNTNVGAYIEPMYDEVVGGMRPAMLVLLGAVGFVLLIACANVANLILARAAGRQRELAVRVALGARRMRLMRQIFTENLLVSVLAGIAGVALTFIAIRVMVLLAPTDIPRLTEVRVDATVLAFTTILSVITGFIFGLAPTLTASRTAPGESMKTGGKGSSEGTGNRRLRSALVMAEIAVALLLLVGAGLLMRSFYLLQSVDSGFDPENVLAARFTIPPLKYPQGPQIAGFYESLLEHARALPGVVSADMASTVLLSRLPNSAGVVVEDRVGQPPDRTPIPLDSITPGFFNTMRIALLRGRAFTEQDDRQSLPVVIVNEAFARRYWPGQDALGKRLTFGNPRSPNVQWSSVVGIVADVRRSGVDQEPRPETYFPLKQRPVRSMQLLVRTAGDPALLAGAVKNAVWSIDKDQPITTITTMKALMMERVAQRRFSMVLLGVFAAVALVLAMIGIYGVMSYSVTQRLSELGIRIALGAQGNDIIKVVLGEGAVLTAIGVLAGIAGSLLLTRFLATQLFGISPTDAVTFAAVAIAIALVSLLASYIPARRASRVDPIRVLRHD